MRGPTLADPHHPDPQQAYAAHVGSLSRWQRFVLTRSEARLGAIRSCLAVGALRGRGLEIGALHSPLRIPGGRARVEYGDRLPRRAAAELYGLDERTLVDPAHILSADDLGTIPSESFDFLVSNHLLEHIPDPIAAVEEWLRVLRPGGVLYLSVPNSLGNLYDYRREPVRIGHLLEVARMRGDADATDRHKREHWREVVREVELVPDGSPAFAERFEQFVAEDYPIHFHVYDAESVVQILDHVQQQGTYGLKVLRRYGLRHGYEVVFVVRRTARPARLPHRRPTVTSALLLVAVEAAARARAARARSSEAGPAGFPGGSEG